MYSQLHLLHGGKPSSVYFQEPPTSPKNNQCCEANVGMKQTCCANWPVLLVMVSSFS